MINVAIAEDNVLALKSILLKLSSSSGIQIVLTASDGEELLQKISNTDTHLVLMDIEMGRMDGISATRELKKLYPEIKVIMLTTFDDDEKIFSAILAGASGYMLKDESSENIIRAVTDVFNGGAAMSPGIALKTLNYVKREALPVSQNILSAREIEIVTELKNGLAYKQIAAKFFISEGTVRKHIENIYRKLEVNNKVNAVNIAVKNKWI